MRYVRAIESHEAFVLPDGAQGGEARFGRTDLSLQLPVDGAPLHDDVARHVRERREQLRPHSRRKILGRGAFADCRLKSRRE